VAILDCAGRTIIAGDHDCRVKLIIAPRLNIRRAVCVILSELEFLASFHPDPT
jgi:hypothetical protein